MEIAIGIILAIVALVLFGKLKGPPDPASMSIEALLGRMQSEGSWIERYKSLPYDNQQGTGIKKQYEDKKLYVMQLQVEILKRGLIESGKKPEETLIPIMQRRIELMRSGMSEEEAGNQATNEFVKNRDANLSGQTEKTT
ncbi:hypothetical protein KJ965_04815 [Patescibacteria group bacterium]|nr:hypothetical protein [Patescibacteria group bacterium]